MRTRLISMINMQFKTGFLIIKMYQIITFPKFVKTNKANFSWTSNKSWRDALTRRTSHFADHPQLNIAKMNPLQQFKSICWNSSYKIYNKFYQWMVVHWKWEGIMMSNICSRWNLCKAVKGAMETIQHNKWINSFNFTFKSKYFWNCLIG